MNKINSAKTVAVVTTAIMVTSIVWLMNTRSLNSSLQAGLKNEKLKSESFLSEKLLLEKDLRKIKDQLLALQGNNSDLDRIVTATKAKLEEHETDYLRLKKENQSLAQVRKQREELLSLQRQLQNELVALKDSYIRLESRNDELTQSIASLQERNKLLTEDLNRAMFAAIDQAQIQAVKRSDKKITVKAKQTRKLIADFKVPANLKQLSFRIVDPKGNILHQNDGSISSSTHPSVESYTASATETVSNNKLQKVQMVYTPKAKLNTGVYTVEILNENLYVASLKVKLK